VVFKFYWMMTGRDYNKCGLSCARKPAGRQWVMFQFVGRLINTSLQRGEEGSHRSRNRFNGNNILDTARPIC
jgi:hypothetical protein